MDLGITLEKYEDLVIKAHLQQISAIDQNRQAMTASQFEGGECDLICSLEMDTLNFVGPIEEAANVAKESGERVIHIIHEQEM